MRELFRRIKNAPKKALCILLVCASMLQISQPILAAEQVLYVEDIQLCTSGSTKEAQDYFNKIGYTMVDADLNAATGTGKYVYMGYKTTEDRTKAITDIKMMPMDGGYQTYDYNALIDYVRTHASDTGITLKTAADGFIDQYNAGSPRAMDALLGLNMFRVADADQQLGDFILAGKADQDFFIDLMVKSSSAALHAVANFLGIGLSQYNNSLDDSGNVCTTGWAGMVSSSYLWELYEEGLTADQEAELARRYEDTAKMLFKDLQRFTMDYENARTRYENNDSTYSMSVEIETLEDGVENMEEMTPEDADISYLTAFELLQSYDFDETTKMGDWLLNIGHMTLETVDLKQLYPVVESMGQGMASLVSVTGFLSAVWNLGDNTANTEFEKAVEQFHTDFGADGIDLMLNMDEAFKGKLFGYTSSAIRKHGAENLPGLILDRVQQKTDEWQRAIKEIGLYVGIASAVIAGGIFVAKFGIAMTASALGTAAATSSITSFLTSVSAGLTGFATFGAVIGVALLVVSLAIVLAVFLIKSYEKENKADFQSRKPDYFFDQVTAEGIDSFALYQSVTDYSDKNDLDVTGTITNLFTGDLGGSVGDLNAKQQWRWVVLCYTKDPYIGSPVRADENGEIFKVVYGDPSPMEGYDSVRYFDQRDAGDMNAHCEKNGVQGIYMHYTTEASLASRAQTPINPPDPGSEETEPVEDGTQQPAEKWICSGCGEEITEDTVYCPRCGKAFPAVKADPTEPTEPSSQTEPAAEPETDPAAEPGTEPGQEPEKEPEKATMYIYDIFISIGKSAMEAQSVIKAHKDTYYVLDYNLSPSTELYTCLGYALTSDPKQAMTDLRIAPYSGGGNQPVAYGDIVYTCIDTLGHYTGKDNKQTSVPADALYYSKNENAGSPIVADGLHIVTDFNHVEAGWEPISYFGSDLPYNFDTCFGALYGSNLNYTWCKDGKGLNNMQGVYLYYEPSEKYTSGEKYLSGMFFEGVYDTRDRSGSFNYENYIKRIPHCDFASGVNLAASVPKEWFLLAKTLDPRLYLCYTWTYNPKRAISNLAIYQGDTFSTALPYTMSKKIENVNYNYVAAVNWQQQYLLSDGMVNSSLAVAGAKGPLYGDVIRFICPQNAYMNSSGSILGDLGYGLLASAAATTSLPEGIEFGYSKTQFLPTELYVSGHTEGVQPLTLKDVVLLTDASKVRTSIDGVKVKYELTGKTLAGTDPDADRSFRQIPELKNTNSTALFNLSYPDCTEVVDKKDYKSQPLYLFLPGQQQTPKKYISSISMGTFSREIYQQSKPKASKDELKAVDAMADCRAMADAIAGCTDELIVCNIMQPNQNNAWYNKQSGGYADKEAPEDNPAAYLGVNRTDDDKSAIKGLILYQTELKQASETITIDGVKYSCAGTTAPIYIGGDKYYLYYTQNSGAIPGVPIREIRIDSIPLVNGTATNLCGKEGSQQLFGNSAQPTFIHLIYDQKDVEFYDKLFIGRGKTIRSAMCDLLAQGCVQYVEADLNHGAEGDTVLVGYRTACHDWDTINSKGSASSKQAELTRQENSAIFDIIVTNDEPFHPEGIVSKGIYYTPVSSTSLNAGCPWGAALYMYYASPFYSNRYNKNNFASTASPEKVFTGYITRLAFAKNERVPYTTLLETNADWVAGKKNAEATGNIEDYFAWEYVMESGDAYPVDLNEGAIYCNKDYCEETRMYMFARRSDGSVKPAGEITGGFVESKYDVGDVYVRK